MSLLTREPLWCPNGHNLMAHITNRLRPGNEWWCFDCGRWFRRDELHAVEDEAHGRMPEDADFELGPEEEAR